LGALAALSLLVFPSVQAAIPAFPGAEGYGAYAVGGRGGDVYHVTNLNSSGAGSFAEAISTVPAAGRTIVFDVSGYIRIPNGSGGLRMTASKVTIAGQTAPGDGIGFFNNFFRISGDDIVIRHVRFRHGKYGSGGDCIDLDSGCLNAVLDHVSLQFSTDENMSSFGSPPENLTLQYSLNAWGLESHSCGGLWDQNHATSHHNLWAHNHTRNPKSRPGGLLEWINNVTFDWDIGFIMGDSETNASWKANVINNYFICPPGNTQSKALVKGTIGGNGKPNFTVFLGGNLIDNDGDGLLNGVDKGYTIVEGSIYGPSDIGAPGTHGYYQSASAISGSAAGVTTDAPLLAYKKIVSNSGALRLDAGYGGGLRDEVDTILMTKLTTQKAFHVSREGDTGASAGGFGVLASAPAPMDSDRDGMPDAWETALGFNAAADDHNTAFASSGGVITGTTFFPANTPAGYTYLEEYLHFLAIPHAWAAKNTASAPSAIDIDLRKFTGGFADAPVFTISNVLGGVATQSGPGGALVHFVPTVDTAGRAKFDFTVTDAQASTWKQQFAILVSTAALPRDLAWKGDGAANAWNSAAPNWLRGDTSATFDAGDFVTFDDSGSATPPVSLTENVAPTVVTVGSSKNYTFAGGGSLTASGGLVKRGTGTLTIANTGANAIGGNVFLQEGTLALANGGFGPAKITMQGGTLTSNYGGATALALPGGLVVPAGVVAAVNMSPRMSITGLSGSGTLNLAVSGTTFIHDALNGSFAGFTGTLNITGTVSNALLTAQFNGGGFDGALGGATVNLDNVKIIGRHNSGGNTLTIGALSGTSTAQIVGSGYAGAMTLAVGALNRSTTFAGAITDGVSPTVLNKTGGGSLILAGANTYTGATNVSGGWLNVDGSLAATPVTVASGAFLGGRGGIGGAVTANAGATLSPGTAAFEKATLTLGGGLSLKGNTLYFDMSSSPSGVNDRIVMTGGTLALSGTQSFQFALVDGSLGAGSYDLVTGAGALSGTVTLTHNLPTDSRQTFTLSAVGTTIRLTVAGNPASLVWTGVNNGGAWDIQTTANWSGGPTNTFFNNDAVTFDDTSSVGTVTLASPVAPRLVTVSNNTRAYTFTGAGAISGAARIIKSGSAPLTLSGANSHSGGVTINGGSTIILANDTANAGALGSGPLTLNGGTLTMYDNTAGYSGSTMNIVVPAGQTGTLNADSRHDISGTLTGGGTANFRVPWIRTDLYADWSQFAGRINVTTDADGGHLRMASNYAFAGFPKAAEHLDTKVWAYYSGILAGGAGTTVEIGELSGAAGSGLQGGPTAGRNFTYRIGGRTPAGSETVFAGDIWEQAAGTTTSFVKTGAGIWTLSGAGTWNGGTTVEQGTLRIRGSIVSNGGQCNVAAGATLELQSGALTVDSTNVAVGGKLVGAGTITGDLNNDGSVTSSGGGTLVVTGDVVNGGSLTITAKSALQIDGTLVNVGTLLLTAGGRLTGSGVIENKGIIDMMTGSQQLPAHFVNNGIVLDSSRAAISGCSFSGDTFTVSVNGYTGHDYQLQRTTSLQAPSWQNVGSPMPGTGALAGAGVPLDLVDPAAPGAQSFYRVVVTP
jgi:autotransporter-associated beta strand protein